MEFLFWLFLFIVATVILAIYSMGEMAMVSFNKIRIQFYLQEGSKKASWLHYLITHPSQLFGTTLIGVNVAMMFGSEFAREIVSSVGLDPDWAPLMSVPFVIIFGELAPQFAARRFSEHVALLLSPILYISSIVLAPFVLFLGVISRFFNRLMGGKETHHELFLTLDELQRILEEQDEDRPREKNSDFDSLVASIFRLRGKTASRIMTPLKEVFTIPANTTVQHLRKTLKKPFPFIPIYNREPQNIIGIVSIRNLIRSNESRKVRDYSRNPWFIAENTPLIEILKQFRKSSETVACVLDSKGGTQGFINLDDLLEDIFGKAPIHSKSKKFVDVTVDGDMTLEKFNKEFGTYIEEEGCTTLSDFIVLKLEHNPEEGEIVFVPPYELIVKEVTLLDVKSVQVKTQPIS
jgi:CBS domain containing-hemolysin-like protein